MEHELLRERGRLIERHATVMRRWSPDTSHPEMRRELLAIVEALEQNLIACEAAGLSPLELSRTTRSVADGCADLARNQRVPHGDDRRWLVRALRAYHRACELLEGVEAPADHAELAFRHANAIRRLDPEDGELLSAAKERYEVALQYFEEHDPTRAAEAHEALDALRVLLEIAPPVRKAGRRTDVTEVKAALRSEEDLCTAAQQVRRQSVESGMEDAAAKHLANRVAEIVAALPPARDHEPRS